MKKGEKRKKSIGDDVVKFIVSENEQKCFLALIALRNSIDKDAIIKPNSAAYTTFLNPENVFGAFLNPIEKPSFKQIMLFTVYAILRKIYIDNGNHVVERLNDIKPMPVEFIVDKSIRFLSYSHSVLKSIIDNGYNSLLDGYNEGILPKRSFKSLIDNHNSLISIYEGDRKDISNMIEDIKRSSERSSNCDLGCDLDGDLDEM